MMKRSEFIRHRKWVAKHRCLACVRYRSYEGHTVSQAAHVRFLSGVGMGQKDDRFCVPLCLAHHAEQHAAGNEERWWDLMGVNIQEFVEEFQRESPFLKEAA